MGKYHRYENDLMPRLSLRDAILFYMLNLDFICHHPEIMLDALQKRGESQDIDELLRLADRRRALVAYSDQERIAIKKVREQLRSMPLEARSALNEEIHQHNEQVQIVSTQIAEIEKALQQQLLTLPNIPHNSVRTGKATDPDEILHVWGEPSPLPFTALPHWELGKRLDILDSEMGVRIAGGRFTLLKGAGARLERALISWMLDVHTSQHGYMEVMPPQLVKSSVMQESGQLPKFVDQAYACTDDLYLNPTAEVPLIGMHSHATLTVEQLPLRYVAWTTAYRREAGSTSRHTHGLMRLHQFNKIELFQYVEPEYSYHALSQILAHAEAILQLLRLPYRVVALNTAQLPFSSAKTFDIEVWMPGMQEYVEVSSISNCEAFQARRANIKYRARLRGHAAYVHTLNGSGLAVGRTMAALLENYQQKDATILLPEILKPYLGGMNQLHNG